MGHRSTRLQRQIERHLSGTLADYVARRRAEQVTWRNLAIELTEATGVEVSYEALRSWFDSGETAVLR
jgi:predicted GIY-YIG superfamily endonuclease